MLLTAVVISLSALRAAAYDTDQHGGWRAYTAASLVAVLPVLRLAAALTDCRGLSRRNYAGC